MIGRYALVSGRIRQELRNLERVVNRIEGAMAAARRRPEDQDFYLDSVALNLHDLYTFNFDPERIERLVGQIRSCFDQVRSDLLAFADFVECLATDKE